MLTHGVPVPSAHHPHAPGLALSSRLLAFFGAEIVLSFVRYAPWSHDNGNAFSGLLPVGGAGKYLALTTGSPEKETYIYIKHILLV